MKFPPEIRRMIYSEYLTYNLYQERPRFIRSTKSTDCRCGSPCNRPRRWYPVNLALAFTSKQVSAEVLPMFYRLGPIVFSCPCELVHTFVANKFLRANIKSVMVRWIGPESDKAFAVLGTCRRLRKLRICISQGTTEYPTAREAMMKTVSLGRKTRLCDALGIDELLRIRGLAKIRVSHVNPFWDERRTEAERLRLEMLLRQQCLKPKEDEGWVGEYQDDVTVVEEESVEGSDTGSMLSELLEEDIQA